MVSAIERIIALLSHLGFAETESRVYLTLLEKGEATPAQIAKESGVKRSTTYAAIQRLHEKGLLIRGENERGEEIDRAATADVLIDLVRKRAGELNQLTETLTSFIANRFHPPKVSIHYGITGLREVADAALNCGTDHLIWGVLSSKKGAKVKDWYPEFSSLRQKKGLNCKVILPKTQAAKEYQAEDSKENRRTFLLKKSGLAFATEILVFGNKVAFINHDQAVVSLIEDEAAAKTMQTIFQLCLESAEKNGSK